MKSALDFDVAQRSLNVSANTRLFEEPVESVRSSAKGNGVKVAIVAPFFPNKNMGKSSWIDKFVEDSHYDFTHIAPQRPLPKWHDRKSPQTILPEWLIYLRQAVAAYRQKPDVVISVFPQLAASAGLLKLFTPKTKMIAWMFNVGTCHEGIRRTLAKLALSNIDLFVVHTRREVEIYSRWLNMPKEKFVFIPYQSPEVEKLAEEDTENPFVAAMGSAHRDYKMFAEVIDELQLPTVVASGKAALKGVDIPACMQTPFGISKRECLELTQRARVNVIPLLPKSNVTAAGQVTLVEAMFMGKVLVATEYYGVEDYIEHEKTGLLVKPHDRDGMRDAIKLLWNDGDMRKELARNAQEHARECSSDEAAGRNLRAQLAKLQ